MNRFATIALALALAAALKPAQAHDHDHHEHHETYAAGEPGDPTKPSRMSELTYEPIRIEVKQGEQIRFVLRNLGTEDHEFLLATTQDNLRHAAVMKKHPHMEHDEPNVVRLAPKKTAEIVWKFAKPGTFEYSCLIPNHREYGMTGHVTVK
jgi:uncharacterized cupredoxin-like copper-binding protein